MGFSTNILFYRMPYFVYILQSLKDYRYYIGSTSNVEARINFHNSGLQRSTKNRIPFTLVLFEEYKTKTAALKREKQMKSWKGGKAFERLVHGT
jgi:putative endonuclease